MKLCAIQMCATCDELQVIDCLHFRILLAKSPHQLIARGGQAICGVFARSDFLQEPIQLSMLNLNVAEEARPFARGLLHGLQRVGGEWR